MAGTKPLKSGETCSSKPMASASIIGGRGSTLQAGGGTTGGRMKRLITGRFHRFSSQSGNPGEREGIDVGNWVASGSSLEAGAAAREAQMARKGRQNFSLSKNDLL